MQKVEQHLQTIESRSHPATPGTGWNKGGLLAECCLNRVPGKSSQHPHCSGHDHPLTGLLVQKVLRALVNPTLHVVDWSLHQLFAAHTAMPGMGVCQLWRAIDIAGWEEWVSEWCHGYSLQKAAATSHRFITAKDITSGPPLTPPYGLILLATEMQAPLGLSVKKSHPSNKPLTYTSISRKNKTFPVIPKRTSQAANV